MGAKNVITKGFMEDRKNFSDAFNYYVYDGEQVIHADTLTPVDTTELGIIFANEKSEYIERIRDVLKECIIMHDDENVYILLGVENESKIHYAMPVKDMVYDALNYAKQVAQTEKKHRENKDTKSADEFLSGFTKDDILKPVITLTIYWGTDNWDGPRSLKEMFGKVDESILKYVNDYKLNLILPTEIKDFSKFTSEFGKAMKYIAVSKDKEEYRKTTEDDYYKEISVETAQLLNECVGTKIRIKEKEDTVMMCKAWEDQEAEGIANTLLDVVANIQKNLSYSLEQALSAIGKTQEDYEKAKLFLEQRNDAKTM